MLLLLTLTTEMLAIGQKDWDIKYPESEAPYFVRVDQSGAIYVIGRYYVQSPDNGEVLVNKYLPDGSLVWSDTSSGDEIKLPIDAELDEFGNVYVLTQYASDGASPTVLYRFDTVDGGVDWVRSFYPTGNWKQSGARDLTIDSQGNIIFCANFVIDDPAQPLQSNHRAYLVRYSPNGTLMWEIEDFMLEPSVAFERLNTTGNTIYVMGSGVDATDNYDGFVVGYNLDGDSLWIRYSGLDPVSGVSGQGHASDSAGNSLDIFSDAGSTSTIKFNQAGDIEFNVSTALLGFSFRNPVCSDRAGNFYWIATDDQGYQRLQTRNAAGSLIVDIVIGSYPSPFPISFSASNTLLTWDESNTATQYGLSGIKLWNSDESYALVGDFVSSARGETYWIAYQSDEAAPGLLQRKLVKYNLGTMCGDADGSLRIDVGDAVHMLNYIFAAGGAPLDRSQGDFDCNSRTDVTDVVYLILYLFAGGDLPCTGCR